MSVLLTIAAGVVAVTALMLIFERRLIYFPSRTLELEPGALGLRHGGALLVAEDGVKLHAWPLPIEGARRTVLVCNGNAGNMSYRLDRAREMQRRLGRGLLARARRVPGELARARHDRRLTGVRRGSGRP